MTTALAYGYDADSARRTSSTGVLVLGSAIDEKDRYWGEGRVRKAGDPQVPADGTYTYNRHGDMKTATLGSDTRTFYYNAKHRLRWTQVGEGDRIYYQWDTANDRRTGMGVGTLVDDVWQAPATFKTTYTYDDSGALTLWDDKTDASHEDQAAYLYDGEGQRYRTVLTEGHDLPLAEQTVTTTDYLYDGLKLVSLKITKKTGTGTLLGAWQLLYFYDAAGRAYAGIDRKLDSAAGTTHSFYLFANDRGDVLQLQDADHVAFAAYRYDAYGRPTATSIQGNTGAMPATWAEAICGRNVLRYAGYVYDTHSGLYYLQRRHYDPITRQFLSRDPLRSDGDESPYQYCAGDPVAATDPWGLYVTASGEKTNTEFYVSQSGKRYRAGDWRPHSAYLESDYFSSLYYGLRNARTDLRYTGKLGGVKGAAAAFGTALAARAPATMGAAKGPWPVIAGAAAATAILAGADVYDQWREGQQADAAAVAYRMLVEAAADDAKIAAAEDARAKAEEMRGSLHRIAKNQRTTAVLVTDKGVIVAGSGQKGTRELTLLEGMIEAINVGGFHAEQNALWEAGWMRANPIALGIAGPRSICRERCQPWIVASGGRLTSPYTAVW